MQAANVNGAGMKAAYAAVKSDVDYQKRKATDAQQVRRQRSLQARAAHFKHQAAAPHSALPPLLAPFPLASAQVKPQANKRLRADENAHDKASALIDELLETRQFGGVQPPPPAQAWWVLPPPAPQLPSCQGPCEPPELQNVSHSSLTYRSRSFLWPLLQSAHRL